ncbi:MAG: hypothetical protein SGARI_002672 [Bacillariaceae sp.]
MLNVLYQQSKELFHELEHEYDQEEAEAQKKEAAAQKQKEKVNVAAVQAAIDNHAEDEAEDILSEAEDDTGKVAGGRALDDGEEISLPSLVSYRISSSVASCGTASRSSSFSSTASSVAQALKDACDQLGLDSEDEEEETEVNFEEDEELGGDQAMHVRSVTAGVDQKMRKMQTRLPRLSI